MTGILFYCNDCLYECIICIMYQLVTYPSLLFSIHFPCDMVILCTSEYNCHMIFALSGCLIIDCLTRLTPACKLGNTQCIFVGDQCSRQRSSISILLMGGNGGTYDSHKLYHILSR